MGQILDNIQNLEVNKTFNSSFVSEVTFNTVVATANDAVYGYLGLGIMTVIYFSLLYVFPTHFGTNPIKTYIGVSALALIVGIYLLFAGYMVSLQHFIWFVALYIIGAIMGVIMKVKNG